MGPRQCGHWSNRSEMTLCPAVRPLAIRFSVDIVCSRSERRLRANSVEKHRVAVAEISVFN
jgi:hypothetical protein